MKCPNCHAKLMPVDGDMFCLQCGMVVQATPDNDEIAPEDTTDPLLQEAVVDAVHHAVRFRGANDLVKSTTKTEDAQVEKAAQRQSFVPMAASAGSGAKGTTLVPIAMPQVAERSYIDTLMAGPIRRRLASVATGKYGAWIAGILVFVAFLLVNVVATAYYSTRIYPGVSVDGVSLGGVPFSRVQQTLAAKIKPDAVSLQSSNGTVYVADTTLTPIYTAEAEAVGRDASFGLEGLIKSLTAKTLSLQLTSAQAASLASQIVPEIDHSASSAHAVITDGRVLLLASHNGDSVSNSEVEHALMLASPGKQIAFSASVVSSSIETGQMQKVVQLAQKAIDTPIQLDVAGRAYSPSVAIKGQWILFDEQGPSVAIDANAVNNYVDAIPGLFSRAIAAHALINAMLQHQALKMSLAAQGSQTVRVTAQPKTKVEYTYCLDPRSLGATGQQLQALLNSITGWSLNGQIQFVQTDGNCNFTIGVLPSSVIRRMGAVCKSGSSCVNGNWVEMAKSDWNMLPVTGKDLSRTKQYLVNNVMAKWFGFHGLNCSGQLKPGLGPISIDGCSLVQ